MQIVDAGTAELDNDDRAESGESVEEERANEGNSKIEIGQTFDSFEEFEKWLNAFEDATFARFYRRDCMTIPQCRKNGIKKHIAPQLQYYFLTYWCMHGGKNFKTTSTGRRKPSTKQKDCLSWFKVTVSKGGDSLVISKLGPDHNHRCSKELYQHYPQSRKLNPEDKEEVKNLLRLDANRKKVKHQIEAKTGKVVLLKDLSNIVARSGESNNLVVTVQKLEEKYGAECHIYEEDNVFKGLFFATQNMKSAMKAYPEFVGIDATFKLLDIRAPVYLMIVEDSEGCTEIVAACILMSDDKASMTWFLDCFKKAHPSWISIKSVMADKDLLEREVIKSSFPSASVLICVFHSLRTFNREITCDKLGITAGQRDSAKEIFQKMVYTHREDEYMKLYERLEDLPQTVQNYFETNWHSIRDEWTLNEKFMRNNFLNTSNNRIESMNAKIKSVIKRFSTLEDFVDDFFILVSSLNTERDHKAAYTYHKRMVVPFGEGTPELFFSQYLTSYGYKFVQPELKKRATITIHGESEADLYEVHGPDGIHHTTHDTCDCVSHLSMQLPCRHIFAVRDHLQILLAEESLCSDRWTRRYYHNNQRIFNNDEYEKTVPHTVTSMATSKRILSQQERYRKAIPVTNNLAALATEVTGPLYIQRMKLLAHIQGEWQANREVAVPGPHEAAARSEQSSDSEVEPLLERPGTSTNSEAEPLLEQPAPSTSYIQQDHFSPVPIETTQRKAGESPPHDHDHLSQIIVPPALKRRGRPKGVEKTIIGLPKKRKLDTSKKIPFAKRREEEKIRIMMGWFVDSEVAEDAISKNILVEESAVESRPDHVTHAILDKNVYLPLMKRFFTTDAWRLVSSVFKMKISSGQWNCGICGVDLDATVGDENSCPNKTRSSEKVSVICDFCLTWYHLPCVPLKKPPKTITWMCRKCQEQT